MMREELVFGPIHSRRLGSSLGINLLPTKGKLCNFDCVYCECGWNKDGREDKRLPSAAVSRGRSLRTMSIHPSPFSLNPDFARIIDITLELRDKYFPDAKVSVLSNATRVSRQDVFEALRKVDNPILKIDAPSDELAALINQPQGEYHVDDIVAGLMRFEGDFVLQTMFLRSSEFDSSSPEVLNGWMDIVRRLRPREIMVYTLDREAPAKDLVKFSADEMRSLVKPLVDEGFSIQVRG